MDRFCYGSNLLIVKRIFIASPVLLGYRNMLSRYRSWLRIFPSYSLSPLLTCRRNTSILLLPCTANFRVIRNLLLSQNSPMEQVSLLPRQHLAFHHRFLLSADILSSSPTFMFSLNAYPSHKSIGSVKITCNELFDDPDKDLFLPVPFLRLLHRRSRRDSTPSPLSMWSLMSFASTKPTRSTPVSRSPHAVVPSLSRHTQSAMPRISPPSHSSSPPSPPTCLPL